MLTTVKRWWEDGETTFDQFRRRRKELDAEVYDTLEFAAEAFDGIGQGPYLKNGDLNCPVCAHGLLFAADAVATPTPTAGSTPLSAQFLNETGISGGDSDDAVIRILKRKGHWYPALSGLRVSFQEYVKYFNIRRKTA